MIIPESLYAEIIGLIPIACVDIVIRRHDGCVLLIKRRNEPLRGEWWVVGGRLQHGESAVDGARRKARDEVGIAVSELRFLGYFEGLFNQNAFNNPRTYHTLSLVFEARLDTEAVIRLDSQSSHWKWADALPPRFVIASNR